MSNDNPNSCCGESIDCCTSNQTVPDRLMATIATDCGNFEIPMFLETHTFEESIWAGLGDFECRIEPASSCMAYSSGVTLICTSGGSWEISLTGICDGSGTPDSISCGPLLATKRFDDPGGGCVCYLGVDITITES